MSPPDILRPGRFHDATLLRSIGELGLRFVELFKNIRNHWCRRASTMDFAADVAFVNGSEGELRPVSRRLSA